MFPDVLCLCIAGTDTDAGKTVVTAALARAAVAAGFRTLVLKPVQTGSVPDAQGKLQSPDMALCREAAPGADLRALVQFSAACSPHLAAQLEAGGEDTLSARTLVEEVNKALREWHAAEAPAACRKLVLLEGAGGLLTPLSASETLADFFALLGWPVLLVAANRLGAVNHALLSLEMLRSRHVPCPGFVMTEVQEARSALEQTIVQDNPTITASLGHKPCLAKLPHMSDLNAPHFPKREAAWKKAAQEVAQVLKALEEEKKKEEEEEECLPFDKAHLWHPYTSPLRPLPTWEATGSQGSRIQLKDGRTLIDGMASWWCAIHGYRHPALMRALQTQAQTLPHVMFGGLTHAPAVRLGRRLLEMAPPGLGHVFFADSGSTAVEAALKMALQYGKARGRTRILTVRGGYHGDTLGAMSVGDPEDGMHALFSPLLPRQLFAPRPSCRFGAPYAPASEQAFAQVLCAHADLVAAVIVEPIVQGAGGMHFYHPDFLRAVAALCKQHGCLLILDEIATGFGRTGKLFACEHAEVAPDIVCLGKGLSGGVLSLAAVLATREVAEGIGGAFMHGSTFMANPLACAVGEASLQLLAGGGWQGEVARIERALKEGLSVCTGRPGVEEVRVLGAIGVVEMEEEVEVAKLQSFFVEAGVWVRPFGKIIYLMPPYVVTDEELSTLCGAIDRALARGLWR